MLDDLAICTLCQRVRLRPPVGMFGTNDVACESCGKGYSIEERPVTTEDVCNSLVHNLQCRVKLRTGIVYVLHNLDEAIKKATE